MPDIISFDEPKTVGFKGALHQMGWQGELRKAHSGIAMLVGATAKGTPVNLHLGNEWGYAAHQALARAYIRISLQEEGFTDIRLHKMKAGRKFDHHIVSITATTANGATVESASEADWGHRALHEFRIAAAQTRPATIQNERPQQQKRSNDIRLVA